MNEPPKIPTDISNSGKEIWDWAANLSAYRHRQDKIRDLQSDIRTIGSECGDCDKWMKSGQCPRERNVNGRNVGPSCSRPICSQFVEGRQATKRRQERIAELETLTPLTSGQGK